MLGIGILMKMAQFILTSWQRRGALSWSQGLRYFHFYPCCTIQLLTVSLRTKRLQKITKGITMTTTRLYVYTQRNMPHPKDPIWLPCELNSIVIKSRLGSVSSHCGQSILRTDPAAARFMKLATASGLRTCGLWEVVIRSVSTTSPAFLSTATIASHQRTRTSQSFSQTKHALGISLQAADMVLVVTGFIDWVLSLETEYWALSGSGSR